jgi:hypothetical protein
VSWLKNMTERERYRWIIRGLVVLVVILALAAGVFQEELRVARLEVVRLQNTVQNHVQMR